MESLRTTQVRLFYSIGLLLVHIDRTLCVGLIDVCVVSIVRSYRIFW